MIFFANACELLWSQESRWEILFVVHILTVSLGVERG